MGGPGIAARVVRTNRPILRSFGALALVLAVTACNELTQIVLVVDTDLAVPGDLDRIDVEAALPGDAAKSAGIDLADGSELPATLALVCDGAQSLDVVVTGRLASQEVVRRHATTTCVPGKSLMLRVDLLRSCRGVTCEQAQTCGEDGCTGIVVEPSELPSWRAPPPARRFDAGEPEPMDASSDAPMPDAAEPDGGSDGGMPDAGPACPLRHPPTAPTGSDSSDGRLRWFAVDDVVFFNGDLGYDLDGLCTLPASPVESAGCMPTVPLAAPATDGADGVDNQFSAQFADLITRFATGFDYETAVNASFHMGNLGVLMRLDGWNGTDDDPRVDFALADAVRGVAADGSSAPRFDGMDTWYPSNASFTTGDITRPLARDMRAYVRGGILVAHPNDGTEVTLGDSVQALRFRLNGTIITARILVGPPARLSDAVIAARWNTDAFGDALPNMGVCRGSTLLAQAQRTITNLADTLTNGDIDPTFPCDALSLGIGFGALETRVGEVMPASRLPEECIYH